MLRHNPSSPLEQKILDAQADVLDDQSIAWIRALLAE